TKVGAVVCLSFLCLVGVVLGMKMRSEPTDDELALNEEIINEPQPIGSSENTNSPTVAIPTQANATGSPSVIQAGALQSAQPLPRLRALPPATDALCSIPTAAKPPLAPSPTRPHQVIYHRLRMQM